MKQMDYTKLTLGQLLSSDDITIKRNAMSILKTCQKCDHKIEHGRCIYCLEGIAQVFGQEFLITGVTRADLESIGYDVDEVSDATMKRLASKMSDAYCENGFWIDLPILADALGIPKCTHQNCDDEGACHKCGLEASDQ